MQIYKTRNITDLSRFNTLIKVAHPKVQIVLKFGESDLRFTVADDLTPQESTAIGDFTTLFLDYDPELKVPKIIDLAGLGTAIGDFRNINYKLLDTALIPDRTVIKGEVSKVDWFAGFDENGTLIDKVLSVDIVYNRDAFGFAKDRTVTRTWANRDGSENVSKKVTKKYYDVNLSDTIVEGIRRRGLICNSIQLPVLTCMKQFLLPQGYTETAILLKAKAFMDSYDVEFSRFKDNSSTVTTPSDVNYGRKCIIVLLEDTDDIDGFNAGHNEWLNAAPAYLGGQMTIRNYLINEFDI